MNNAKRGQIPPYAIFFMFYISRVVVSLTYIQTICVGMICSDLLISVAMSLVFTMIMSIPAYLCVKNGANPLQNKLLGFFYCAFFIVKAGVNIARFTGFATSRLNPDSTNLFFAVLIGLAVSYCAYLGIEGLSRFSSYAGLTIMIATVFIIFLNSKNMRIINLYPIIKNDVSNIYFNAFLMTSNSIEAGVLICLQNRINGDVKRAYFGSIFAQYLTIFALIFVMLCVLGSNASLQAYPIFTLFQMATGNTLSRLDIVHTAFWVVAAFVKCTLLIYTSSICLKKFKHKSKCVVFTVLSVVISLALTFDVTSKVINVAKPVSIISYLIFCLGIPLICFIVNKFKGGSRRETIS